jgi:hypothetical protein
LRFRVIKLYVVSYIKPTNFMLIEDKFVIKFITNDI